MYEYDHVYILLGFSLADMFTTCKTGANDEVDKSVTKITRSSALKSISVILRKYFIKRVVASRNTQVSTRSLAMFKCSQCNTLIFIC